MGTWPCRVPWWACPGQQPKVGSQLGRRSIAPANGSAQWAPASANWNQLPRCSKLPTTGAEAEISFGLRYPGVQFPDLPLPECKPEVGHLADLSCPSDIPEMKRDNRRYLPTTYWSGRSQRSPKLVGKILLRKTHSACSDTDIS